jgi:hypothetical protein
MPVLQATAPEIINLLAEVSARLTRLERSASKPQQRFNQREAAEFLNKSAEWLRREKLAGRGPKGKRRGREWEFTVEDLNAYAAEGDAE